MFFSLSYNNLVVAVSAILRLYSNATWLDPETILLVKFVIPPNASLTVAINNMNGFSLSLLIDIGYGIIVVNELSTEKSTNRL